MADDQGNQPPVATAAVAIRPPPFSTNKINAYFTILEAQLQNGNIVNRTTKFRHLLSNLPIDVVDKLSEENLTCDDYDELKQALISIYAKPDPQIFNELLTIPSSLTTKPSIFLQQLKTRASQLNLSEDFLKIYFIQTMPVHIRSTLLTNNGSLDDLAKVADTLIDYNLSSYNCANANASFNPISHVATRPQFAPRHPPPFNADRYPQQLPTNNDYLSQSIPAGLRAFHAKQKPRVCRAHIWFGRQARTCKPWCLLNDHTLPLTPNSRAPSRSSSPVRSSQAGNL